LSKEEAVLSNIHSSAVMNLVFESASIFPETLRLDIHHFVDLQKELKYQVCLFFVDVHTI